MGDGQQDLTGDGFLAGAGLELRLNAIFATMSIFMDYTFHHTTLQSSLGHMEGNSRMMTVGVTLGL